MTDTPAIPGTATDGDTSVVHDALPLPPRSQPAGSSEFLTLERRTLKLNGKKTSIALEPQFWWHYERLAEKEGTSWRTVVSRILGRPAAKGKRRSAFLRVLAHHAIYRIAMAAAVAIHKSVGDRIRDPH